MVTRLRIWIDGELRLDEQMLLEHLHPGVLADHYQQVAVLAGARRPWRMELGDRDADVDDTHWPH
jgi:hypothetical protein